MAKLSMRQLGGRDLAYSMESGVPGVLIVQHFDGPYGLFNTKLQRPVRENLVDAVAENGELLRIFPNPDQPDQSILVDCRGKEVLI